MRIRTIKPEFFLHEGLFEAESSTGLPLRIAFAGLWGIADREGRFKWEPRKIGAQVLPYDGVNFSEVLESLERIGLVVRYGDELQYGVIPTFLKHQCINIRESKSILPEPVIPARANTCKHVQELQHVPNGVNLPIPLRLTVFARDGEKCLRCGAMNDLTVDHIFPQSIGGTHAIANLRTLCRSCNSGRPVAGQALLDDLARDGFTMADMHHTCMHVQACAEGKGKEQGREGKEIPPNPQGGTVVESLLLESESSGRERKPKGLTEGKGSGVYPTTPQALRVAALMKRKATTAWPANEVKAYQALGIIPEDDLVAVETFYAAEEATGEKLYRRNGMLALLNNFAGEVDKARAYIASKPPTKGIW